MQRQQKPANETDTAPRFRLAHDDGTDRWMVIEVGTNARGTPVPIQFFGPYDNEIAARIRLADLERQRMAAATLRRRLEQLADA